MATTTDEFAPLLPTRSNSSALSKSSSASRGTALRPQRTVTFDPRTTVSTYTGTSSSGPSSKSSHNPSSALTSTSSTSAQHAGSGTREPMLSAFNSKLRRRNSVGTPLPTTRSSAPQLGRPGAQRTTKTAQKLKLLPNPETDEDGPDEESGRDVYSQFTRIKDPTARRDAARLGRADRDRLPRVTAYCAAQGYRLEGIMKFMKSRGRTRGANPKLLDECLYSPYDYQFAKRLKQSERRANRLSGGEGASNLEPFDERVSMLTASRPEDLERRFSDSAVEVDDHLRTQREGLIDLQDELGLATIDNEQALSPGITENSLQRLTSRSSTDLTGHREQDELHQRTNSELSTDVHTPEVFVFDYGAVVIWGMTMAQEQRFLNDISKFSEAPLPTDSVQTEEFNFYYTQEYQARIYNDFISLRDPKNYMNKLAISHALAQSAKTSLFEDLVSETIETTSPLPALIAQTGSANLTAKQLNMQIGELFILRINIHLQGSVLDSPELMWAEPHLEPVYSAVRSYLEIGQRVELLNERLDVIGDLLAVLREQGVRRHGEVLEWIVIFLIAAEIVVAAINIAVDVFAGEG